MAAEGDIIIRYIFTGERALVPRNATHVTVHESVTVIPRLAFYRHPNIVEFKCHDGVEKIERAAFSNCPSLRRVKIPGVIIVEWFAFGDCDALTDVECGKLEFIGELAFISCKSLRSINLPSIVYVNIEAFFDCEVLTDVKFGDMLETIEKRTFSSCASLERITLPLKDGIITADNVFRLCENLKHVDLVGGVHETVDALPLDDWKNDMKEEINSINQILPNAPARYDYRDNYVEAGGKAQAVREWIRSVLRKLVDYKHQHCYLLTEATTTLELVLPQDIVIKHVIPFLELPSYTFEVEEEEEEEQNEEEEEQGEEEEEENEDGPIRRKGLRHCAELIIGRVRSLASRRRWRR